VIRTIATLVVAALALAGAAAAEPLKLRVAYSGVPGHLTALMQHVPKDVIPHWGKTYVVDPIFIQGSGPAMQAQAAKEIDLAGYSYQSFANAVIVANLDIRVVEECLSDKAPNGSIGFYARPDSDIRRIEDVRGKVVGINARGSTIDAALHKMMSDHGLTDGKDYQIVEVRFDALPTALRAKRVDVALLNLPFNLMAEKNGEGRKLFTLRDALGPTQNLVWTAWAEFVGKNRAAMVDFLEDDLRMRRWLYDPKNRDAALKILTTVTKQPAEAFADYVFTVKDSYRDMNGDVDPDLLQKNVDDLQKLGLTKATFDVKKYMDMSLVREAAGRLRGM